MVEAQINIFRTGFIVLVLGLASIYFTKDAQELVLDPLERMIEKIKAIAKNPLVAATEEVNEAGIMSFMSNSEDKS
jgi:class 3 adenylate cyclase